tara:strand:+ start:2580 stop:3719 length:1140 start_codon:yes stop_codon:yes gene_type:complete
MPWTAESLQTSLFDNILPVWMKDFVDLEHGGYHERLDWKGTPLDLGYKRLYPQCRLTYVSSHASSLGAPTLETAQHGFSFIKKYWNETGWSFKLDSQGNLLDPRRDLTHTVFILLACGHYYSASKDPIALWMAKHTLSYVKDNFALEKGYVEALDANNNKLDEVRRQNPHMHFFEGCLAMYKASGEQEYLTMADELFQLCNDSFVVDGTLREYFTQDLLPHPTRGHIVEPGHHFEWAWLLLEYNKHKPNEKAVTLSSTLLEFALTHGVDHKNGGIFDEVDNVGNVVLETKRIWPVTEAIKACSSHYRLTKDKSYLNRMQDFLDLLFSEYLDEQTGRWREHLTKDLHLYKDFMPSTTPYHLFLALSEAIKTLEEIVNQET